jgi:hypothetical protein
MHLSALLQSLFPMTDRIKTRRENRPKKHNGNNSTPFIFHNSTAHLLIGAEGNYRCGKTDAGRLPNY